MPAQQRPPISHQKTPRCFHDPICVRLMRQDKGTFGNMDCRHAAEAVGVTAAGGKSQSNQPGTERSPYILLLFTSVPLSARTATWLNYSRLTLLPKKGLLSGQLRQKSWLKEAAPNCTGSRRKVRSSKSIVASGRLDIIT